MAAVDTDVEAMCWPDHDRPAMRTIPAIGGPMTAGNDAHRNGPVCRGAGDTPRNGAWQHGVSRQATTANRRLRVRPGARFQGRCAALVPRAHDARLGSGMTTAQAMDPAPRVETPVFCEFWEWCLTGDKDGNSDYRRISVSRGCSIPEEKAWAKGRQGVVEVRSADDARLRC